jgi:hypothetical protein
MYKMNLMLHIVLGNILLSVRKKKLIKNINENIKKSKHISKHKLGPENQKNQQPEILKISGEIKDICNTI